MSLKKGKLDQTRYIARCFNGKHEIELELIGECMRMASVDPQSGNVRKEIVLSLEDIEKFCTVNCKSYDEVIVFFQSVAFRHCLIGKGYKLQFAAQNGSACILIYSTIAEGYGAGFMASASQWANYIEEWNNREAEQ